VFFQEIKMKLIFASMVRGMWGGSFTGWIILPTSGALIGIILMCDKRAVGCIEEVVGTFCISCKFKSIMDQFVWAFQESMV
jgi:hypothetical protein